MIYKMNKSSFLKRIDANWFFGCLAFKERKIFHTTSTVFTSTSRQNPEKTTTAIYPLWTTFSNNLGVQFLLHSLSAVIGVSFFDSISSNSSNPNSSPCYQINFRRSAASARRLGAFVATCSFQDCLPCSAWFGPGVLTAPHRASTFSVPFGPGRLAFPGPVLSPQDSRQCKSSGLWFVSSNPWDDGFDGFDGSKSQGPTFN